MDLDQIPNTITANVTAVNDAPSGSNNTVTTLEDGAYTFAVVDFGFGDPDDIPAMMMKLANGTDPTTAPPI